MKALEFACKKCGTQDLHWMYYEKGTEYFGFVILVDKNSCENRAPENQLLLTCKRCSYQWKEVPLDERAPDFLQDKADPAPHLPPDEPVTTECQTVSVLTPADIEEEKEESETTWNYRLIRWETVLGSSYYGLHEVGYDANGTPANWTKDPIVTGDTPGEIMDHLKVMLHTLETYPVSNAPLDGGALKLASASRKAPKAQSGSGADPELETPPDSQR